MAGAFPRRFLLVAALLLLFVIGFLSAHELTDSGSCPFASSSGNHDHGGHHRDVRQRQMLPEELAEEEDLRMEGSLEQDCNDHHDHYPRRHHSQDLSTLGLWLSAMGCSLLVSLASLICLIILPVIFLKGAPSKVVVDALATFGAGAMLGDAFLHQLPHAFSGGNSHSHDQHIHENHEVSHSHSHSLQDLSVGLSVLFGIVLFLLVEKIVRYVEGISGVEAHAYGHAHHHHHPKNPNKLKNDDTAHTSDVMPTKTEEDAPQKDGKQRKPRTGRKKANENGPATDAKESRAVKGAIKEKTAPHNEALLSSPSSLVFGYLNLFSDGVHNFTDGMALGSAFLLYGSVGGWSRTVFLLAHELPQEIGDFGILVRSGFTVSKALFFNFLSALVALFGTASALLLGKDPGQSSLIEGFTAGGFIYIAAAGVLPEMNNASTTFRSTLIQLGSLILGMGVALSISLTE